MKNLLARALLFIALSCSPALSQPATDGAARAQEFVAQAEKELAAHSVLAGRADWINQTYLTDDSDALAAEFGARGTALSVRLAKGAAKFDHETSLPFPVRRKLNFLKQGIVLPAPEKDGAAEELATIATGLQSQYGKGKGTLEGKP